MHRIDAGGLHTTLSEGDDLDNYTTYGDLWIASVSIANSIANTPVKFGMHIKVRPLVSATGMYQEAITNTSTIRVFRRRYTGTSWDGWTEYATVSS